MRLKASSTIVLADLKDIIGDRGRVTFRHEGVRRRYIVDTATLPDVDLPFDSQRL